MHIVRTAKPDLSTSPDFLSWYRAYPNKVGRVKAVLAWAKLSKEDQQAAIEALPQHIAYWATLDWYTPPYPATWLNGRRWEDELPEQAMGYCAWTGCKTSLSNGGRYCSRHQAALARGETPTR